MLITNDGQLIDKDMKSEFPVKIARTEYHEPGPVLKSHWHEEFMIFYIEQGEALIHCNSQAIPVCSGDLIVINSNEVHYLENLGSHLVEYYLLINFSFLLSRQEDLCQTKYIAPLMEQHFRFQNHIKDDKEFLDLVLELIHEYEQQDSGYELLIKAGLYRILVLLMRRYITVVSYQKEDERRNNTMDQLRPVLQYVDRHYAQKLTLTELAAMANMSRHHFCRLFKSITGKPPIEYINHLRLNEAMKLLNKGHLNISEIALAVGFNDSNYFSRLFKKYKNCPPTHIQKKQ